jgi:hypothetical protein
MGEGTLSEAIYAFIGAYSWYLTAALYIVLVICQALLGGDFSLKRRPRPVIAESKTEA